jgi:hypothetical protein
MISQVAWRYSSHALRPLEQQPLLAAGPAPDPLVDVQQIAVEFRLLQARAVDEAAVRVAIALQLVSGENG